MKFPVFALRKALIALLAIATAGLAPLAHSQETPSPEELEKRKQDFFRAIEQRVVSVLDEIELTEEQSLPMQKALVGFFATTMPEQMKMRAARQEAAKKSGGNAPPRVTPEMRQSRAKTENARTALDSAAKKILEGNEDKKQGKKQYKKFKEVMEKLNPQQRRGGPGGGGRGGR